MKGSKETLLGDRRKGREVAKKRRRGNKLAEEEKASASNSVFTGRDRKTVEIVVATLSWRPARAPGTHLHTSSTDLRFEFFNSYC